MVTSSISPRCIVVALLATTGGLTSSVFPRWSPKLPFSVEAFQPAYRQVAHRSTSARQTTTNVPFFSSSSSSDRMPRVGPRDFSMRLSVKRTTGSKSGSTSGLFASSVASSTSIQNNISQPSTKLGTKRFVTGMAFLSGWCDVLFHSKLQTFCTMMTGNTMWMCKALAEQRFVDSFYYSSVILAYMIGITFFYQQKGQRQQSSLEAAAAASPISMPQMATWIGGLFVTANVLFSTYGQKRIAALLMSFGFALINSVGTECGGGSLCFVLTGHMTKLSQHVVAQATAMTKEKEQPSKLGTRMGTILRSLVQTPGTRTNLSICGGFGAGALWGYLCQGTGGLLPWMQGKEFAIAGLLFSTLLVWKDQYSLRGNSRLEVAT